MSREIGFVTGTKFVGDYNCSLRTMHGIGRYTFPDQSEYSGFFHGGRFHGYGTMTVTQPVTMTFKGHFEYGKLKKLEHVEFADGLIVKGDFTKDNRIDFSKWNYCTPKDRRYQTELDKGLEAVGPGTHLTSMPMARKLSTKEYDIEEGVYSPKSGFVTKRPEPFNRFRFVGCPEEKQWILRHCRRGSAKKKSVVVNFPNSRARREIIDLNRKAMMRLGDPQFECPCNSAMQQKNFFRGLCTQLKRIGFDSVESLLPNDWQEGTLRDPPPAATLKIEMSESISPSQTSFSDKSMQPNWDDTHEKMHLDESLAGNKSSTSLKSVQGDVFMVPSHLSQTMYTYHKQFDYNTKI